ncbi:MAG: hypothetical protein D6831_03855 [Aquificota bacterium]|nr:MAG: hypothetical protein D6831_03855 [Aquificota bacterium]
MTLQDILEKIHALYEGDTSYPSEGSEDWNFRLKLVNNAIDEWAYVEGVYWKELFKNLSDATDGDKTATTSTTAYNAPSDFRFISSFVQITDSNGSKTLYGMVRPDEVLKTQKTTPSSKVFYITGNPSTGYKINILNPIDGTISYSYYKTPASLSSSTDKPEMSNPMYIVYSVVAQLYELDNRNDLVGKYLNLAKQAMDQMVIENETKPFYNPDGIEDLNYELYGATFGE